MRWMLFAVISLAVVGVAFAEDWTTTDGKTYKHVHVVKVEDDAVTILDEDGGALVPLSTLPPDLQKKFNYDPAKAAAAAAQRASADAASEQAVQTAEAQEKAQAADQAKKLQAAMAAAAGAPASAPAPSSISSSSSSSISSTTPSTTSRSSTAGGGGSNESSTSNNGGQFSLNNKGLVDVSQDTAHQHFNPDWKLVWSDEFDGPDIDKSKWNFNIDGKGEGNGELEYYSDSSKNAHIETDSGNGMLHITAIKGDDGHKFTSARMDTKGKFSWKYGRFEARIKMPQGKGCWPAFWLMPEDSKYGGWASSGELDIVEMVGGQMKEGDGDSINWGTIHYGDKWPKNVHTGDHIVNSDKLSNDFHTYAVEWEPGVIRWYFDGNLYEEQNHWYTKAAPFPAPFDQKFYVILNFAVGGAWPGKPDDSTQFPQDMVVDYVRVYQAPEWIDSSTASN